MSKRPLVKAVRKIREGSIPFSTWFKGPARLVLRWVRHSNCARHEPSVRNINCARHEL